MKKLQKKIGALALVGLVLASGIGASGIKVDAVDVKDVKVEKVSKEDVEKYSKLLYNVELPDYEPLHHVGIKPLLGNDRYKEVRKQIKEIMNVCKGSNLIPVKLSSEYGKGRGIRGYLDEIKEGIKKAKGGKEFLKGPSVYFDDVDDLRLYLEKYSEQIESGVYKIQVGNVDGIYIARSGRAEGGEKGK